MNETARVCEKNGESLSTVLGECCSLSGKAGHDAWEVFRSVFDSFPQEKGFRVAFSKLISEEAWDETVKCMKVPDWIYLFFKLKSRISDCAWQDLTNLTKLGRTGVSCTHPCKLIYCLYCSLSFAFLCRNCRDDLFLMGGGRGRGSTQQKFWCRIVFLSTPLINVQNLFSIFPMHDFSCHYSPYNFLCFTKINTKMLWPLNCSSSRYS